MWLICWGSITTLNFGTKLLLLYEFLVTTVSSELKSSCGVGYPWVFFLLNFFFSKVFHFIIRKSCGLGYPWVFFLLKSFSKVFHFIVRIRIFFLILIFIALYVLFNFYFYCFGLWWLLLWLSFVKLLILGINNN